MIAITQKRTPQGNWICAICGTEALKGYAYGAQVICGECKQEMLEPKIDDAVADDPRRGQAAGINAMRRRVGDGQ